MLTRRNLLSAAATFAGSASGQIIETSQNRVRTNLDIALPYLGTVRARSTKEISGSNWLLGCETLDRDFADYDQYKEYIAPLGINIVSGAAHAVPSANVFRRGTLTVFKGVPVYDAPVVPADKSLIEMVREKA